MILVKTYSSLPSDRAEILRYAGCKAENEDNTRWFLEQHPEFELVMEQQLFPGRETDGFYIAKFNRRSL